ncbi:MAG TPA: hypothetical protein DEG17_10795 [Cyanobacteria bacterium UBA11149]|nr:hypothetical protein [Cyanobacteria bacterium UBA11367]HBE56750.1 hypothetical protein [Cyanobacteria bacterium UBA11366]HBK62295.1 hypothetical protein [Cyanobacteria bacterium UBA11166]HBR72629.1 hypothetical protein [Cyanobacteria bacterium UBA11159]HBS70335.1 hypothetical protein [Cyanobacteria bacterium UBA11153]HBW89335.1 hypothetical protein [Cyanobacteria bacterium UBA11149]HCA93849.1 hypothetical protein [Cyanobacteria bacterium UBA9226]
MSKVLNECGLLAGATYPFRVVGLFIRNPHLWSYTIAPIIVNVVVGTALYGVLLFWGLQEVEDLTASLSVWLQGAIASLPAWLSFLTFLATGVGWLLNLLLILGLLLLIGFLLVQFCGLLGAPWYGQLSEQVEKLRTGKVQNIEVGIVRDIGRAILFELKKLALVAGVGILLTLVNIIPGIGTAIATVGGLVLAGTIVCLDFLDSPLERRRLRFRDKLGIVWGSFPATASFSLVCTGLMILPFLNLVTIPICVASGTLFVCDRVLPKTKFSVALQQNHQS